jgi:hypothetical protein
MTYQLTDECTSSGWEERFRTVEGEAWRDICPTLDGHLSGDARKLLGEWIIYYLTSLPNQAPDTRDLFLRLIEELLKRPAGRMRLPDEQRRAERLNEFAETFREAVRTQVTGIAPVGVSFPYVLKQLDLLLQTNYIDEVFVHRRDPMYLVLHWTDMPIKDLASDEEWEWGDGWLRLHYRRSVSAVFASAPRVINGYGHPHASQGRGAGICMGDGSIHYISAIKRGDIAEATEVIWRILTHYNANSPYVAMVRFQRTVEYRECDCCGKSCPVIPNDELAGQENEEGDFYCWGCAVRSNRSDDIYPISETEPGGWLGFVERGTYDRFKESGYVVDLPRVLWEPYAVEWQEPPNGIWVLKTEWDRISRTYRAQDIEDLVIKFQTQYARIQVVKRMLELGLKVPQHLRALTSRTYFPSDEVIRDSEEQLLEVERSGWQADLRQEGEVQQYETYDEFLDVELGPEREPEPTPPPNDRETTTENQLDDWETTEYLPDEPTF